MGANGLGSLDGYAGYIAADDASNRESSVRHVRGRLMYSSVMQCSKESMRAMPKDAMTSLSPDVIKNVGVVKVAGPSGPPNNISEQLIDMGRYFSRQTGGWANHRSASDADQRACNPCRAGCRILRPCPRHLRRDYLGFVAMQKTLCCDSDTCQTDEAALTANRVQCTSRQLCGPSRSALSTASRKYDKQSKGVD
jgi:hypothetical protein